MKRTNRRALLRVLLITLATLSFLVWSFSSFARYSSSGTRKALSNKTDSVLSAKSSSANLSPFAMLAGPTKPAANLDQVRNGSAASPLTPVDWVNGNAGSSNAHYKEGQSIPYRLVLTNLPLGVNSVKIEWDIRHSSTNAIDYITTVVRQPPGGIAETINVCGDAIRSTVIAGCTEGSFSTFAIPAPPVTKLVGANQQPTTSFASLPANDKLFRIYNGINGSLTYINNADGNLGDLNVANSSTRATISFTAQSSTVVLAWSGHIGSRNDWGFTNGIPNSAGGISGSPYHTRLIELCPAGAACSGGNQDRSLSAAAVEPPAACLISGDSSSCESTTATFTYGGTPDASLVYNWGVTGNASPSGSTTGTSFDVNVGPYANGASYSVSLSVTSAGGTTSCSVPITINPSVAATDLTNTAVCPGGTASFTTTASGTGPFNFVWAHGGTTLANGDLGGRVTISNVGSTSSLSISNVGPSDGVPADYSVTVSGGCGSPVVKTANLVVNSNVGASALSPQIVCAGSGASFSTTASGTGVGTGSFAWSKDSSPLSHGGNISIVNNNNGDGTFTSTLTLASASSADAGNYNVFVDGTCVDANRSASLTVNPTTAISQGPSPAAACAGATSTTPASFSVSASGTGNLHYAWKVNGVDAGGDTSTLAYDPSALAPGSYPVTVRVTSDCGFADANTTLTINSNPTVSILLTNACATSGTLTATPAGGSNSFPSDGYVWTGPGIVSGQGSNQITVNATGTYTVTVTDSNSCSGSVSGSLCFTLTSPVAGLQSQPDTSSAVAMANTRPSLFGAMLSIILGRALEI